MYSVLNARSRNRYYVVSVIGGSDISGGGGSCITGMNTDVGSKSRGNGKRKTVTASQRPNTKEAFRGATNVVFRSKTICGPNFGMFAANSTM